MGGEEIVMKKNIKFGHTAITWANEEIVQAVESIRSCGYWGTETFGWVLEEWENSNKNLSDVFERNRLALTSLYCHLDLLRPDRREEEIRKVMGWVKLYEKFQGNVVVIGGTMMNRRSFSIAEHLPHLVRTLNELGQRIADAGFLCCFHPHTGTPVETEEEIHQVMQKVDTTYVKFAPDLGQIAKGGSDPFKIVKEYYEIIRMVHVKDYIGGRPELNEEGKEIDKTGFLGYTPLGMGVVDIKGILEYLENKDYPYFASVELDGNQWSPTRKGNPLMSALEAIQTSKRYLEQLGYSNFRER